MYLEETWVGSSGFSWRKRHFISKPQLELFCKIKREYPDEAVVLEHPVVVNDGSGIPVICQSSRGIPITWREPTHWGERILHIDVAIPKLKLGFEFYGRYSHGSNAWGQNRVEGDLKRIKLLETEGWKIKIYHDEDL